MPSRSTSISTRKNRGLHRPLARTHAQYLPRPVDPLVEQIDAMYEYEHRTSSAWWVALACIIPIMFVIVPVLLGYLGVL